VFDRLSNFFKTALIPDAVSLKSFAEYNRNFAAMVRAEVPLPQILKVLRENTGSFFLKRALSDLEEGVNRGEGNLHELMELHPLVFPHAYRRLIRAGEEGGQLDKVLESLADYYEKEVEFRYELTRLLSFPVFQLAVIMLIVGCGSTFANSVVRSLGGNGLPFQLFGGPGVALLKTIVVILILWWILTKVPVVKQLLAVLLYSLPFFNSIFKKLSLARFSRIFALCTEAGVPLLEAIELSCEASGNPFLASKKTEITSLLSAGKSLKDSLVSTGVLNTYSASFFAIGESTGVYGESLTKLAQFLEEEARLSLTNAAKVLPVVMTLILGFAVGLIVLNFYSQYFNFLLSF
jgi:type IV pilus assembly protein PilC